MSSILFGSGKLYVKDSTGQSYQVGVLQDVSVNFEGSTKELMGSKQWPIAVAATGKKISGKAGFASIDGKLLKNVFGGTSSAGRTLIKEESLTIALAAVTGTQSATFTADLGVLDAEGNTMTVTGSTPALGSYTVTAGKYGFNASQSGTVTVSYRYTTGSGETITVKNQDMGTQPVYTAFLQEEWDGETLGMEFLAVTIPSLDMSFKNEDFAVENLNFSCQANASGDVFKIFVE
ncbi:hypothetical protein [Anaeromyxobacter sp. PSR-1]|uniref:hypothetical protein n=1 Tax=Anaeromyxobacter sp. PSR-1 TaxID=1300915 RepID=UPI0005E34ED5|nr:hypothetical protein [Anaeromyxobacter sp. PSR-1]GAO01926.1 hypothetical protein PSR1_00789 [Anaeromyxobacter sp. PSR-1]